jgi:drug/metabolite transporter (DMT)-like permease
MGEKVNRPPTGAVVRLVLATAAWGFSFPTAKAVMLTQSALLPDRADWFHAALILTNRMVLAVILMGVLFWRNLGGLRRREIWQGVELGLFGGFGMLLQTHAQTDIPASTSAFFTQFTCIFVPLVVAWDCRRKPALRVSCASLLVLAGCAVLSGFQADGFGFRSGEWETILAALLFTGQILALERAVYQDNDMRSTATVMFLVKALVLVPAVFWGIKPLHGMAPAADVWHALASIYTSIPLVLMTGLLTVFSTVYGYATMTRWQPLVSATQAGLIYATEPLFATLWALFLPGWFAQLAGIHYANEHLTTSFFLGALLILCANAMLLLPGRAKKPVPADGV